MMWYTHTHTHTHNGILCSHQKEWNLTICNDVDRTRGYNAKENKSIRERQFSYDLTNMRNLRNKTEDHRGIEGKMKQEETREEDNHKRLSISGNKLRVAGGEGRGRDYVVR